jgi:hypothetical protein
MVEATWYLVSRTARGSVISAPEYVNVDLDELFLFSAPAPRGYSLERSRAGTIVARSRFLSEGAANPDKREQQ